MDYISEDSQSESEIEERDTRVPEQMKSMMKAIIEEYREEEKEIDEVKMDDINTDFDKVVSKMLKDRAADEHDSIPGDKGQKPKKKLNKLHEKVKRLAKRIKVGESPEQEQPIEINETNLNQDAIEYGESKA